MNAADEVHAALGDLHKARKEFFEFVSLPVQPPPRPAKEEEVAALEQHLGKPLPPSYRRFLLMQDGWPEFDGDVHLLRSRDVIALQSERAEQVLSAISKQANAPEASRWIIIGLSPDSINSYLFDPGDADAEGEWPVMEFDKVEGVEARRTNFTEFLKAKAAESREALAEARQGEDLIGMDF